MAVIACPGPEGLKQFLLGQSSASSTEQVAEHIERCAKCQAALRNLPAEDTLVEAVRAQETLPEGREQDSVRKLVAQVRSLLPRSRSIGERTEHPESLAPEQILAELRQRFAAGRRVRVEEYLDRSPQLRGQRDVMLDLLYNEMLLRQQAGETPTLLDYQERFPELADELRMQFEVDRMLDVHTPPVGSAGADTIAVAPSEADVAEDDGFAPAEQPGEIGRLAGYRVLKLLGVGGMGKVFVAEDSQLRRKVALKVMKPDLARNAKAKQRFLQEARLAAAIEHDHIVHIYQVGEDRGIPFLAMQLLNGLSLEEVLHRKRALKVQQILRIGIQIAEGLGAAHEKGLIHRDIKPANIWIEPTGGGSVKILDFGLARNTADDVGLTQSGTIMGTPAYMPPEQARGDKVDHRCDLYSLGCVLYRTATGELPIKGNDTMAMLMALAMNDPIPPVKLREDLPPALSELILKLLAKDREQRPSGAKEIVAALKAIERSTATASDTQVLSESVLKPPPAKVMTPSVEHATTNQFAKLDKSDAAPPMAKPAKPKTAQRSRGALIPLLVGGAVAALLLVGCLTAGIVFFIPTSNGVIRVEADDPKISFKIDDKGNYTLVGSEGKELSFSAGEHSLKFKLPDGSDVETDRFSLKKNDKVLVKVELLKGKLQVVQDGKVHSEKDINPGAVAVGPGTPIQLKKGTLVPDKSSQALPGLIPYPALRQGIGRWQVLSAVAPEWSPFAESPDGRWMAVWKRPYVSIYDAQTGALKAVGRESNVVGAHHLSSQDLEWSPDSKWVRSGFRRGDGFSNVHFFAVDGSLTSSTPTTIAAGTRNTRSSLVSWMTTRAYG